MNSYLKTLGLFVIVCICATGFVVCSCKAGYAQSDERLVKLLSIDPEKLSIKERQTLLFRLSKRLFSLVQNDDFATFQAQFLFSKKEFVDSSRLTQVSTETIDKYYSRYLKQFQSPWQHLQKDAELQNIQWQETEFLDANGSSSKRSAQFGVSFRANHQNYGFTFAVSAKNGKWRIYRFSGDLKSLKERDRPSIETTNKRAGVKPIRDAYPFLIPPPERGYSVVYFNTKTMEVLSQEHLNYLEIIDNRDRMGPLHPRPGAGLSYKGANSRDVAIYAITKIETEKDVPKWLYFWGGNSMFNYQVDIDGIIIKSRHQSYNKFDFTKGRHLVEVLVMPNGSTIPFYFDLKDKVQDFSRRELQASFKEKGIEDFDLWMASFYSPDKCSESVEIELEDSIRPVVLLLSNEEAAFVNIKNSKGSKLKAVLLRNFLTDVQFDANGDIPVYGMLQPHSFMYVKSLFEDDPNVSYGSIVRQFLFKNVAQTFPGKYISGFSYHRKPSTFRVPETHIRKKDYIRAKKELEGL